MKNQTKFHELSDWEQKFYTDAKDEFDEIDQRLRTLVFPKGMSMRSEQESNLEAGIRMRDTARDKMLQNKAELESAYGENIIRGV